MRERRRASASQVGHGIDVGAEGAGARTALDVQALEWQDAEVLGEPEVPGDGVGVQPGGVDDVAGVDQTVAGAHAVACATRVRAVIVPVIWPATLPPAGTVELASDPSPAIGVR